MIHFKDNTFAALNMFRIEIIIFYFSIRSILSMEFRTTQPDGVMFYFSDPKHKDHLGLTMKDGMIRFTFNSGTGTGELMTSKTYNDGQWHKVTMCFVVVLSLFLISKFYHFVDMSEYNYRVLL
jgi:hypothetical protein